MTSIEPDRVGKQPSLPCFASTSNTPPRPLTASYNGHTPLVTAQVHQPPHPFSLRLLKTLPEQTSPSAHAKPPTSPQTSPSSSPPPPAPSSQQSTPPTPPKSAPVPNISIHSPFQDIFRPWRRRNHTHHQPLHPPKNPKPPRRNQTAHRPIHPIRRHRVRNHRDYQPRITRVLHPPINPPRHQPIRLRQPKGKVLPQVRERCKTERDPHPKQEDQGDRRAIRPGDQPGIKPVCGAVAEECGGNVRVVVRQGGAVDS